MILHASSSRVNSRDSSHYYARALSTTGPVNAGIKHGTFIGLFIYFIYLCGAGVKLGPVGSRSDQNTVIEPCVCNHKQLKGILGTKGHQAQGQPHGLSYTTSDT